MSEGDWRWDGSEARSERKGGRSGAKEKRSKGAKEVGDEQKRWEMRWEQSEVREQRKLESKEGQRGVKEVREWRRSERSEGVKEVRDEWRRWEMRAKWGQRVKEVREEQRRKGDWRWDGSKARLESKGGLSTCPSSSKNWQYLAALHG